MQINVRDLISKKGHVRRSGQMDVSHLFRKRSDIVHAEPLHYDVQAKSDAGIAEAFGTLTLSAEFVCSRCLSSYCQRLTIPFRERFARDEAHWDEDDDEMHLVPEDVVDLTPFIEQSIQLGLPYIPVCAQDCKGLDPETGANQNIDPAERTEARVDPRLAVLAQLLEKRSDN